MSVTELVPVGTQTILGEVSQNNGLITRNEPQVGEGPRLSRSRSTAIIVTVAGISFLNTLGSGLLTVCLPRIASDLKLRADLLLWPASVYALASGCTLLAVGAVADVVGNRPVFLSGCLLLAAFTLGCALAKTGIQLIMFRAFQGIAMSFCMPTAVGLITANFPTGRARNIAFACFGGGSPIGFALGLVLGGIFADTVGWRVGYYMSCGLNAVIFVAAHFTLPKEMAKTGVRHRLIREIDWVGVTIASTCLAMLSYVFAMVTSSTAKLHSPVNIALLSIAVALMPTFVIWVSRQERLHRPAIVPNSLWRKAEFTSICITVFLTWAMFNAFGYFVTLLFQNVESVSPLQTSLRFLPLVVMGLITNLVSGLLVDKLEANILVLVASLLSAASPALLATLSPRWSYWAAAFPAMCLSPISTDLLFNVSNLVITASFSKDTQALAGGVFNTVSQLGNSVGLAVTAVVASAVSAARSHHGAGVKINAEALLEGYRAAFWACFAAAVVSCVVSAVGLRKSGKVGLKRE